MQKINFSQPIPGASLTTEPKGYAWERPAQYDKPEEALSFYINKFDDEETTDDINLALGEGFPLDILVSSILTNGVMDGIHTTDVKLLIAPVLHEYLRIKADAAGIDVKENAKSLEDIKSKKEKEILVAQVARALEKVKTRGEGTDILEDAQQTLEAPADEPMDDLTKTISEEQSPPQKPQAQTDAQAQPEPQGLMSRRNV